MKYNNSEMSWKYRTFVPNMETKIETTNTGGKVLAYDGEELVGRLDFSLVWGVCLSVLSTTMLSVKN